MLTPETLGALTFALVAASAALLGILLLASWRGRLQGMLLALAVTLHALWAGALAIQSLWRVLPSEALWALEVGRALAWILFLARLLAVQLQTRPLALRVLRRVQWGVLALGLLVALPFEPWVAPFVGDGYDILLRARLYAQVFLAVLGLVLVEQIYRNTLWQHRQDIRYLCFGLGLLFGVDFFVYADAALLGRIDPDLWRLRGPLNLVVIPLVAVSAARNPQWSVEIFISRTLVFRTTALAAAGVYLILMSFAGYWIQYQGAEWARSLQILFFVIAGVLLLLLFFSGRLRARAKVLIAKHFYRSQFDHREEWMRVTRRLSGETLHADLPTRIIIALGELVDRPGGAIWVSDRQGGFTLARVWQCDLSELERDWDARDFAEGLARIGWILDMAEYRDDPARYPGLEVPHWMECSHCCAWVVPILFGERLLGFVTLVRSLSAQPLNWETLDLVKTAANQAASYLALEETAHALAEARQFEGFNRVSAFVVHDLKNLVAQLSLVVRNAERHRANPAFVEDAFATVESAVAKMNRLLLQLRGAMPADRLEPVELSSLLHRLGVEAQTRNPMPILDIEPGDGFVVDADRERLAAVIGNLIQNAQEATDERGEVWLRLRRDGKGAIIEVEDTGCGMDDEFIRTRLFRPFDSTKGLAGMGIGAYECREYVHALGGRLEVSSQPGEGTRMRVHLPLRAQVEAADRGAEVIDTRGSGLHPR